jgi:hypothetical protein
MKFLHTLYTLVLLFCLNGTSYALTLNNDKDSVLALGMEMSNMRNMLEAYILIGAKIDYKNPTKKLKDGILHYEDLLTSIQSKYPKEQEMQDSITISRNAWQNVKGAMELALQNESLENLKKGAIFIHGNIRTVIKEMAHMKKYLLNKSSIKNKKALNASIEIAASARRLSAHYMMDLWHLDDDTIQKHWNKGLKIYGDSIEILKDSPYIYNKKFKQLLRKCNKYHTYFTKMGHKPKIYSILIDKKANIAFNHAKEMTQIILDSNQ